MKIGIIGTGNVGSTLGRRWALGGHEVTFGTRDPSSEKIQTLLESIDHEAWVASIADAAAASDVVVLATPWPATEETIRAAGDLSKKIVVDCINPIAEGMKGLSIGLTTSAAEQIAEWTNGARVVKAFSTTGAKNMNDPRYGSQRVTMFICGDDAASKEVVAQLAEELGFEIYDSGPLYTARYLEPLAMLWVHMAYVQGLGPDFAFKVLRR